MAARSVRCTLRNESTSHDLTLVEATLEHGCWAGPGEPPAVVRRGSETVWESESNGFMTGTEGRAVYDVGDTAVRVVFHWNNPFIGANSFSQRIVPPESGSPSGLRLEDVVAFDPVRDAPRGPRYLHDRPADPVHDDNVAIAYRFQVRETQQEAEPPVVAQGWRRPDEVRATTAPPGRRTTARDATAFPQVVYFGLNSGSSSHEELQLQKLRFPQGGLKGLARDNEWKWVEKLEAFEARTPLLASYRGALSALEAALDPVEATIPAHPRTPVVGSARAFAIRALASAFAEADPSVNPHADAGALRRLVLSGHHCASWSNERPDVVWGSISETSHPHSVLTLFKEEGRSGVLQSVAELFPGAAEQVEHLIFSACFTGYQDCSIPPRMFAMFPNLKTLWAYAALSPGAANFTPVPFCTSSNRSLVVWEAATRLSNDAETLNRASEKLRALVFGATGSLAVGDSRIWTREGPLPAKDYSRKRAS